MSHVLGDTARPTGPRTILAEAQFRSLRSLRLEIYIADYQLKAGSFLPCSLATHALLSGLSDTDLPSLRELYLQLVGSTAFDWHEGALLGDKGHIYCVAINGILCKLQRLKIVHLRLSRVCQHLFAHRPRDASLSLKKLYIQCDTGEEREYPDMRVPAFTELCTSSVSYEASADDNYFDFDFEGSYLPHITEMERPVKRVARVLADAAQPFLAALEAPKVVRIVWPDDKTNNTLVRDVLAGETRMLTPSDAWDAAGVAVQDSDSESESEDETAR